MTEPKAKVDSLSSMKTRRLLVSLATVCALLGQSWAIAGMGPMMAMPAPAEHKQVSDASAMPCHGDLASTASDQAPDQSANQAHNQTKASGNCCDDAGTCAQVCASATGIVSTEFLPAMVPAASLVAAAGKSTALPAFTLTPLRPPITFQS